MEDFRLFSNLATNQAHAPMMRRHNSVISTIQKNILVPIPDIILFITFFSLLFSLIGFSEPRQKTTAHFARYLSGIFKNE